MQYIIGALAGVAISAICLSIYDLFFKNEDFEDFDEIEYFNLR